MTQWLFLLFHFTNEEMGLARLNTLLTFVQLSCRTGVTWANLKVCLLNYFMKRQGSDLIVGEKVKKLRNYRFMWIGRWAPLYVWRQWMEGRDALPSPSVVIDGYFATKLRTFLLDSSARVSDTLIWFSIQEWDRCFRETIHCGGLIQ